MSLQLTIANATGVLYPNPNFGLLGEPPLKGVVYVSPDEAGTRGTTRLEVCAWYQSANNRNDYVLYVGGGLRGALCLVEDDQHYPGCPDFEGAVGIDWELCVEGWFLWLASNAEPLIQIRFFTTQKSHIAADDRRVSVVF
ncbi:hypothetical protein [Roseateles sp. P5_E1]